MILLKIEEKQIAMMMRKPVYSLKRQWFFEAQTGRGKNKEKKRKEKEEISNTLCHVISYMLILNQNTSIGQKIKEKKF